MQFISLFGLKYNEEGKSPQHFVAPPIVDTPAVTVNICMGEVREQGVLPVARIRVKQMAHEKKAVKLKNITLPLPTVLFCNFPLMFQVFYS